MPPSKAILSGKDFKALVAAVRRFPGVGTFAGAGLVHFAVANGKAVAGHLGVVTAKARTAAEGNLPLSGIDERNVDGFAPLCADGAKVYLSVVDTEFVMRCRDREQKTAIAADIVPIKLNAPKEGGIKITDEVAPRVAYLSDIAHSDTSRAELCAVMMTSAGEIMACSQKIIAVMEGVKLAQDVAVPIPLAKALQAGDTLYPGINETLITANGAVYSMQSPVKAQSDFPIAKIREFGNSAQTRVGSVAGDKLAQALTDCQTCLGKLAPVEIVIDGVLVDDKLELSAVNGSTRFKATVPLLTKKMDAKFRAPLAEMCCVIPFLKTKATFSLGKEGDLFLAVDGGWIWLPSLG